MYYVIQYYIKYASPKTTFHQYSISLISSLFRRKEHREGAISKTHAISARATTSSGGVRSS
jgi:hypothetical protein